MVTTRFAVAALIAVPLFAGCKTPAGPTTFGVDVTVSWAGVPSSDRDRATNVTIQVSGDEMSMQTLPKSDFKGDQLRVQYVPQVSAGTLDFAVGLTAADGSAVAFVDSGPVMLQSGKAVQLTLTLAPATPVGQVCSHSLQCGTPGGCVNGFCCTQKTCPACHTCGADGECSVTITNGDQTGVCDGLKTCDAAANCVAKLGSACTVGSDCGSGNCVDGFCCTETSCPSCRQCGTDGECSITVTSKDFGACSGTQTCDLNGDCLTKQGQMCSTSPACITGNCADALCCDAACTGSCMTCNGAMPGTCSPVLSAEDADTCAITPSTGAEMCDAAGTCQTPHLLVDLNTNVSAGTNTQASSPAIFVAGPNNLVFFTAAPSGSDSRLWVTDGTAGGTKAIYDFGSSFNAPSQMVVSGNDVYFSAIATGDGGTRTLWKSDGTSAAPIVNGSIVNAPHDLTALNGKLYFAGQNATAGDELWRTDGTAAGTVLVDDILSGSNSSGPFNLRAVGNSLVFFAYGNVFNSGANGAVNQIVNVEPWTSDGTTAGTHLLADLSPGLANSVPYTNSVAVMGGKYYFSTSPPGNPTWGGQGVELFAADPVANTVVQVADIYPGPSNSFPTNLTPSGSELFFVAEENTHGREVWKTDGTTAGTMLVADVYTGISNSYPHDLAAIGGKLYFGAQTLLTNDEPYVSDGTAAGTVLLKDIGMTPGLVNSYPVGFTGFQGKVFFATQQNDQTLWVTDGTPAGTAHACLGALGSATQCMINGASNVAAPLSAYGHLYYQGDTGTRAYGAEPFIFP